MRKVVLHSEICTPVVGSDDAKKLSKSVVVCALTRSTTQNLWVIIISEMWKIFIAHATTVKPPNFLNGVTWHAEQRISVLNNFQSSWCWCSGKDHYVLEFDVWIFYCIVSGKGSYYFNRITFSCADISFRWIKSVAVLGFYFCLKLSFLLNLPDF